MSARRASHFEHDEEARFWLQVRSGRGCWLWVGCHVSNGYGRMDFRGRKIGAHQASWIIHNGTIPVGLFVCHRCDVRDCVRPDHLFLGTQADNLADATRKGRNPRGESHGRARLLLPQVHEIRSRLAKGELQSVLCDEFGVTQATISRIKLGKSWRGVPA